MWGVPLRGTVGPKLSVGQMARILFFKTSRRKGLKNPAQGRGSGDRMGGREVSMGTRARYGCCFCVHRPLAIAASASSRLCQYSTDSRELGSAST